MGNAKRKIISFWLTHIFLRRIGKRYPEYFTHWIKDITDDNTTRKIMAMRKAIYEHLGILLNKVHRMFESSNELTVQQMLDGSDILKDIAKADMAMSKSCYYDSMRGGSDDRKY